MDPEKLLLESLNDLERIAAFACRRSGFQPADTEDFASFVKLKLIENDYAILRKFEGRSAFRTWLTIVVFRNSGGVMITPRRTLMAKARTWRGTSGSAAVQPSS